MKGPPNGNGGFFPAFARGASRLAGRPVTFALVVIFLQIRPQGLFTVRTRGLA